MCNFTREIINSRRENNLVHYMFLGGQWVFWGGQWIFWFTGPPGQWLPQSNVKACYVCLTYWNTNDISLCTLQFKTWYQLHYRTSIYCSSSVLSVRKNTPNLLISARELGMHALLARFNHCVQNQTSTFHWLWFSSSNEAICLCCNHWVAKN